MTDFPDDFERFWQSYPARYVQSSGMYVKLGKAKAWQVWKKMPESDKKLAMLAIGCMPKSATWIKDSFRWLRDKGWFDYQKAPTTRKMAQVAKTPDNPALSVAEIIEARKRDYEAAMLREREKIMTRESEEK